MFVTLDSLQFTKHFACEDHTEELHLQHMCIHEGDHDFMTWWSARWIQQDRQYRRKRKVARYMYSNDETTDDASQAGLQIYLPSYVICTIGNVLEVRLASLSHLDFICTCDIDTINFCILVCLLDMLGHGAQLVWFACMCLCTLDCSASSSMRCCSTTINMMLLSQLY